MGIRNAAATTLDRGGQSKGAGQRGTTSDHTTKKPTGSTYLDYALAYAARGWWVFPLKPGAKKPITKNGYKDASNDPKVIRTWWAKTPRANIGLACGRSSVIVIDVDGDEGLNTLADLEAARGLVYHTLTSHTPGKAGKGAGLHLLFKMPEDRTIGNKKIGPGLETRGAGGYIVLPPSIHPDHPKGPAYRWADDTTPIADLPQVFIDLLTAEPESTPRSPAAASSIPSVEPARSLTQREIEHYSQAAFDDELVKLRAAREGDRNNQLNRSAFALGQFVGAGALDRSSVEAALEQAAHDIGLKGKEVALTIKSGIDDGRAKPRDLSHLADRRNGHHGSTADEASATPAATSQLCTDMGNARRFANQHGARARYVKQWGWQVWTGTHWAEDETGAIYRLARQTVRSIFGEAERAASDDIAKAIGRWAMQSQSKTRLDALIGLALSEPEIAASVDQFNKWPMLLPVANGMIDLERGALLPHDQDRLMTRYVPIDYRPDATCPTWIAFLDRVMAGNQDTIAFLQRAIGYSLTGSTNEQCLFNLYGVGANGKTVFTTIMSKLLGNLSARAPIEALLQRKFDSNGPTSDLARLAGARVVLSSEVPQNRRLNESLIKDLTGEDEVTACFKYREPFQYRPSFKLWLSGNHKPGIRGTDYGIWRRIHLIPFEVVIPVAERDRRLVAKLTDELPGILNWALRGCLDWQRHGLQTPAEIEKATAAYRAEMDTIANFISDRVMKMGNHDESAREVYAAYKAWCEEAGERAESQRTLGLLLTERGYIRDHRRDGWYWLGIGLKTA